MEDAENTLIELMDDADLDRIAVIGLALRFPGADSPEAFWRNLSQGVESINRFTREELLAAGVPEEKLDDSTYVPAASCLDDIECFDAELFNIGPREADIMDPQQRLFLTVAREALEEAGFVPGVAPGRVGIFAGSSISTYLLNNLHGLLDRSGADLNLAKLVANDKDYLATLTAYKLDLRGPAVTVQSACSTSLIAVHQACQALLSMECDAALAGGVTVRVPHRVGYSNQGGSMLSADGHCRAFDASANGTVPGSGAGVVVLKRLADARRDGDPIHAVILGSAANNDGNSKIGFTAPSVSGQVDVIRNAQAVAGIDPESVGYMEAHGTGTSLGDPIEVAALNQVFGAVQTEKPFCALGSVKSNFGHLECAAGVAGLIKTVLILKHGQIPPSLGFTTANHESGLDESPVYVNSSLCDWPADNAPRRAGVSSFGFGGTNCHMVLEEAPVSPPAVQIETPVPCLLPLSARQVDTLAELRSRYLSFLQGDGAVLSAAEICFSAATLRRHERHRAVLLGQSREALLAGLRAWAQDGENPAFLGAEEIPVKPALRGFLFTGQGAVHAGMGRSLYAQEPVFREVVDRCDAIISKWLDFRVAQIISAAEDDPQTINLLTQASYAQPALFVLEYALAELWGSWGIQPDYVLGHSLGEYAAAAVAGALSLEDALTLVVHRALLMQGLDPAGGMVVLFASEAKVRTLLQRVGNSAEIAVLNSPANVVVGGAEHDLKTVLRAAQEEGINAEPLHTTHGFHTALLEPILERLEQKAACLELRDPMIPLVSTLTGKLLPKGAHTPTHWRDHSRKPVRFAEGLAMLIDVGCRDFIEIGPHPVLCNLGRANSDAAEIAWLPSLRRGEDAFAQIRRALGALYLRGATPQWRGLFAGSPTLNRANVPVMPVRGERHWIEPVQQTPVRNEAPGLLGRSTPSAVLNGQFEATFNTVRLPFVLDHAISSGAIFPATGYIDMALTAARDCIVEEGGALVLHDVEIMQPLMLNKSDRQVQTVVHKQRDAYVVEIFSCDPATGNADWARHCRARVQFLGGADVTEVVDTAAIRARCSQRISGKEFYTRVRQRGMHYGPAFRLVEGVEAADVVSLAKVHAEQCLGGAVDPALLDACCQAAGVFFFEQPETDNFLPVAIERFRLHGALPASVQALAELQRIDEAGAVVDITICDSTGRILAEIAGMRFRRLARSTDKPAIAENSLYVSDWVRADRAKTASLSGGWLLVAPVFAQAEALARRLRETGVQVITAEFGSHFEACTGERQVFNPVDAAQAGRVLDSAAGETALTGVVQFWSPGNEQRSMAATVHLAQAMIGRGMSASLSIVTANAHRIGPQAFPCEPDSALVWGFAAALREEHPELRHRLIDLHATDTDDAAQAILAELTGKDGEDRVAWREGMRFVQRLARRQVLPAAPYRLHPTSTGMLDQMQLKPLMLEGPGKGQMCIRVHATGLNFRDVINALGMFPGIPSLLGGECAGIVEAVGEAVDTAWIGRKVVCGAAGAFSSHILSDQRLVSPIPEGYSFEQAATLPIAYVTAHYALSHVARLAPGERVLIHAGAGGVGQAAIQIAKARGAEIYTTAGSPRKRDFLRAQGIVHVLNSRSLDFAEQIRVSIRSEGIDVVLNALSDGFIPESLALLRKGGRFLEIGKLGIWTPERVAREFPGVGYHIIALDQLIEEAPDTVQTLMREVMGSLANGLWQPPPLRVFDLVDVGEAFRYMQQALHIGKVAVRHPVPASLSCRAEACYLITGGTGALGLETAGRLAALGARRIVLTSRRAPGRKAQDRIAEIASSGVEVLCRQTDICDPAQIAALLEEIRSSRLPLRGVVHAAGVIEDAPVISQSWDAFQRVLAPKVAGAKLLSRETESDPLDFFVLYSSASGELGAAGQGAYAAANAYLDALADSRSMRGLPALSMAWGPWPVGMTAMLTDAGRERLAAMGVVTPDCTQYLDLMEHCAAAGDTNVVAMVVDWERFLESHAQTHHRRRLRGIVTDAGIDGDRTEVWARVLDALPPAQRRDALIERIAEQAARALGLCAGTLPDPDASLLDLGLDSLMAVELRNVLATAVGRQLSATLLFDYPTVSRLADYFGEEIFGWSQEPEAMDESTADPPSRSALQGSDYDISDEAAADLIAAELEKWSQRNA